MGLRDKSINLVGIVFLVDFDDLFFQSGIQNFGVIVATQIHNDGINDHGGTQRQNMIRVGINGKQHVIVVVVVIII